MSTSTSTTRQVIVRYTVKPDRLEEHEGLLRAVFAELAKTKPEGLDYRALKLEDGLSFVHIATITVADNPLVKGEAFKAFTANVKDRCEAAPLNTTFTVAGAYA